MAVRHTHSLPSWLPHCIFLFFCPQVEKLPTAVGEARVWAQQGRAETETARQWGPVWGLLSLQQAGTKLDQCPHEWTQCQSGKTHCGSDRTRGAERGCCRASLRAEHSPEVPCPTTAGPHFSAGSQHMQQARSHSSINTCTATATVGAEVWNAEHTWVLHL